MQYNNSNATIARTTPSIQAYFDGLETVAQLGGVNQMTEEMHAELKRLEDACADDWCHNQDDPDMGFWVNEHLSNDGIDVLNYMLNAWANYIVNKL